MGTEGLELIDRACALITTSFQQNVVSAKGQGHDMLPREIRVSGAAIDAMPYWAVINGISHGTIA